MRTIFFVCLASALFAVGCSPGAIGVPPKLGVARVDVEASELSIHQKDDKDMFMDDTGAQLRNELAKELNEGVTGASNGRPARFRIHVEHGFSPYAGTVILLALPIIDLIPIGANMTLGECDDFATVDVQVGDKFYRADIRSNATYGVRDNREEMCMHALMEAALEQLKPIARPPRSEK